MDRTAISERRIRRIRQIMFDLSEEKQERAGRILDRLKQRCRPSWEARQRELINARMEVYFL